MECFKLSYSAAIFNNVQRAIDFHIQQGKHIRNVIILMNNRWFSTYEREIVGLKKVSVHKCKYNFTDEAMMVWLLSSNISDW